MDVDRLLWLQSGVIARRQLRVRAQTVFRDVTYEQYGREVGLDGRLFHDSAGQRDRDLDRDLDAAATGARTVRLGWGHVFDRPCRTADRLGRILQRGGWPDDPRRCGPGCRLRLAGPTYPARQKFEYVLTRWR